MVAKFIIIYGTASVDRTATDCGHDDGLLAEQKAHTPRGII